MGIKKQTRSRVWSWNQQGCEVPWCERTGISHSKCQISTAVNSKASARVGCGRMRCSAAAGRSGLRRGTSASRATPGSPHPRVLPLPGSARPDPSRLYLPGRPQTPHAGKRARGIPRGRSEPKPGLLEPGTA